VGSLSARDSLRSLAAFSDLPTPRIDAVLDIVGLLGRENDRAPTYSLSMKQRLGIAAALLPDRELLILDEPTNGLDPAGIVEIRALLKSLADGRRTVVVSSHLLGEIEAMVDHLVIIRFGELLYSGRLDALMARVSEGVVAGLEHATDLSRLTSIVESNGWAWEAAGGELIIAMPADRAADLDRAAGAAGFALRMLSPQHDTLETVFLKLTGSSDADLAATQRST
jgi:ABC-2 type transport system ATP-binding protein